ncbi:MAG: AAA family ATPase [Pseudomonadota bacterium]|nr:AAA family ATPase [Pseudomonadota bacterium]
MRHPLRVLLVGRSSRLLSEVAALLDDRREVLVSTKQIGNGHGDTLREDHEPRDVIVLIVGEAWEGMLSAIFDSDAPPAQPLLVIGPEGDVELLRAAMRVGARDFFSLPLHQKDLFAALDRVAKEEHERHGGLSARVTTFVNAKGGSGASFLAANVSHILAKLENKETILVDLEFQFGSLPTYFNITSRNGLVRALELVDTLDAAALQGYTQNHSSGLNLLTASTEGLILPDDVDEERIGKLFTVLDDAYEELVVDLPRRIDQATAAVLDRSDIVVLVSQQTVSHLHQTKRLATLVNNELGIGSGRLLVVVNRFSKKAEVTLSDFAGALPEVRIETLPNDYRNVSQSINLGVPLLELQSRSRLRDRLIDLTQTVLAPGAGELRQSRGARRWLPWTSHGGR